MNKLIDLDSFLLSYQKKLENDFKNLKLNTNYNIFGYQRYLKYFVDNRINNNYIILELGCSSGYGMELFKYIGYNNILGIDFDKEAIFLGRSRGLNILNIDLSKKIKLKTLSEKFDVIILNNVFHDVYENLPSIEEKFIIMFNNIYLFLKKGSIVMFNFQKINGVLKDNIIKKIIDIGFLNVENNYDNNGGKDQFFIFRKQRSI